jgi:transposase-like protein
MQAGLEFWAPHVAAIEQESVPTAEYAKRHGLALHSLYYWRQKIKAATQTSSSPEGSSAFVALTVGERVPAQQPGSCTLVLGPGVRVELPALPTPEWLAALGRAMQGAR